MSRCMLSKQSGGICEGTRVNPECLRAALGVGTTEAVAKCYMARTSAPGAVPYLP